MKNIKYYLIFLLILLILCIPILNLFCFCFYYKTILTNTLNNWDRYKSLLWASNPKVRVIYMISWGNAKILYEGLFSDLIKNGDKYKTVLNSEIRKIDVENNTLIVRLWNTKKLNKLYREK